MKQLFLFFSLAVSVFFIACNTDDTTTIVPMDVDPLAADVMLNVSYGSDAQQVYDIYLPEGRTNLTTKTIILVHGGGWIEGDKEDMTGFISLVQDNHPNHAIVNINYKLATIDHPAFPNQFLDLDAVINQLTAQSTTLQIKPEYGLIGTSAGAHISLQYDSVYDTDNLVKFVCDIVGPTDFTDPFYQDNPGFDQYLDILTDESAYAPGTNIAQALSPALQINANTSPTILFYGNQDDLVPLTNGETLNAALQTAGITHQFTVYNGGHGNWDAASFEDVKVKLSAYINQYLAI